LNPLLLAENSHLFGIACVVTCHHVPSDGPRGARGLRGCGVASETARVIDSAKSLLVSLARGVLVIQSGRPRRLLLDGEAS